MKAIISFLFIVFVVCLTFTVLPGWIPLLRNHWVILALAFVLSIVEANGYYKLNYMSAWYIYIFVVLINAFSGDAYFINWISTASELYKWIVPPAILFYAIRYRNLRFSKALLYCLFFIIFVEGFATFYMNLTEPNLLRNVVQSFIIDTDPSIYYPYYQKGMASYSFAHSVAILIPPFTYIAKDAAKKKIIRIISVILLSLCLILVYLSGSTTALLLGAVAFILSMFSSRDRLSKNKKIIFFILLTILPFILSDTLVFGVLNTLDEVLTGTYFHSKVSDFADFASTGKTSGDIQSREILYAKSIMQWLQSPLYGTNDVPGYHSALFDRLATLGLLGFIPLILFIYHQMKYTANKLNFGARIFYYEGFLVGILLLLLKDSDDWETF